MTRLKAWWARVFSPQRPGRHRQMVQVAGNGSVCAQALGDITIVNGRVLVNP